MAVSNSEKMELEHFYLDKLKETISNMITISNTNGNARINVS
jgi:hypothetical protein